MSKQSKNSSSHRVAPTPASPQISGKGNSAERVGASSQISGTSSTNGLMAAPPPPQEARRLSRSPNNSPVRAPAMPNYSSYGRSPSPVGKPSKYAKVSDYTYGNFNYEHLESFKAYQELHRGLKLELSLQPGTTDLEETPLNHALFGLYIFIVRRSLADGKYEHVFKVTPDKIAQYKAFFKNELKQHLQTLRDSDKKKYNKPVMNSINTVYNQLTTFIAELEANAGAADLEFGFSPTADVIEQDKRDTVALNALNIPQTSTPQDDWYAQTLVASNTQQNDSSVATSDQSIAPEDSIVEGDDDNDDSMDDDVTEITEDQANMDTSGQNEVIHIPHSAPPGMQQGGSPATESSDPPRPNVDPNPVLRIAVDETNLDEQFANPQFQFEQRQLQLVNKNVFSTRTREIKKLQSQFRNVPDTCVIYSKHYERQSSREMRDNAWLSMRRAGFATTDFVCNEANSPYIALIAFKNTDAMQRAVNSGKIEHWRYDATGDGKNARLGDLFIEDLRVNRFKFTVTGANHYNYAEIRDAYIRDFKATYDGLVPTVNRYVAKMYTDYGQGPVEEESETDTMDVEVTVPVDSTVQFYVGDITVKLDDNSERTLTITSKNYSATCRKCGGPQDECRRNLDGELRWACKELCYFCHLPNDLPDHNETECQTARDANPRALRARRTLNDAWYTACYQHVRKPISLAAAKAAPMQHPVDIHHETISLFKKQAQEKHTESVTAAEGGANPFLHPRARQSAEIRQAKLSYADMAKQKAAQTGQAPPAGTLVYTRLEKRRDEGTGQYTNVRVEKEIPMAPPRMVQNYTEEQRRQYREERERKLKANRERPDYKPTRGGRIFGTKSRFNFFENRDASH